ncbi:phage tail tape measure protein [Bacillus pseudomycoides]|uniref:phage tail tape measure protein n=1 Tax=Bacillus pseudomycoides TaxID=64104 RepID=UPI000BFDCE7D|nr:phage tail tape measure protein [Bacillus pseudomycoides]PHB23097.1 phage tail tape measure protein [Bacillus pseudomycoides]PHE37626.1 phage tail tape measure protein [Bacillus pseudomycoides]
MAQNETIAIDVLLNDSRFRSGIQSIIRDLTQVRREAGNAGRSAESMGSMFKGAATQLAAIGAAVGGIALVKKGLEETVNWGMSYTKQMSKVEAITGSSSLQMADLGANARELGASTVWSATNVAEAYEYMALAGWDSNQMLAASKPLLNLATTGALDLAKASDIVTDTMTPFGMKAEEAGKAADIFAVAQSKANLNVEQMGETMKYAAPIADTFGMNLSETAVIAMEFANGGIKASMAGTALRAGLSRLAAPPKAAREALAGLNVTMTDSEGNMKNIRDIIAEMSPKFNELSESQQIAAAKAIFGEEAYAGWVMVLKNGVPEFDRLKGYLDNSSGAAERMAGVMSNNLSGAMANASSAAENLGLIIFSRLEKALTGATNSSTGFIDSLSKQLDPYGKSVEAAKLLQTEQQKQSQTMAMLDEQLKKGEIDQNKYNAEKDAAAKLYEQNTTKAGIMQQKMTELDQQLASGAINQDQYNQKKKEAEDNINKLTMAMDAENKRNAENAKQWEYWKGIMMTLWEAVKPIWDESVKWLNEQLKKIKDFIANNGEELKAVWNAIWVFFDFVIKPILDGIKQAISGALDVIMGIIKTVGAILNGDWKSAWDGIKMTLSGVIDIILGLLNGIFFKGALGALGKLGKKLGEGFVSFAGKSWNKVKQWGKDILDAPSSIKELPGKIWEWIKDVPSKIKQAFDDAIDWLKRLDWGDIGKSLIKSLIRGIESMFYSLTSTVSSVASKLNPLSWFGGRGSNYMIDPENNTLGEAMPRSPFGFDILDESRGKFNRLPLQFFAGSLQEAISGTIGAVNGGLASAVGASRAINGQLSASRSAGKAVGSAMVGQQESVMVTVDVPLYVDGNAIARATDKYTQPRNAQYAKRTRTPFSV